MNPSSNPSPYRHTSAKSVRTNAIGTDPATTPLDPTKSTAYSLAHRLHLALHDLGILRHVPSEWWKASPEGLSFRTLGLREADEFVLALEDVVLARTASEPLVSPRPASVVLTLVVSWPDLSDPRSVISTFQG